jgi:hypothetical protein
VLILFLGCTDVGSVAKVTEVHAASVFRVEVFTYIYPFVLRRNGGRREIEWGLVHRLGQNGQWTEIVVQTALVRAQECITS